MIIFGVSKTSMNQLWLDNKFMNLKLIDGSIMGLAGWAMTLGKKKDTFVIWEIIAQRSNPPHKPQLLCTGWCKPSGPMEEATNPAMTLNLTVGPKGVDVPPSKMAPYHRILMVKPNWQTHQTHEKPYFHNIFWCHLTIWITSFDRNRPYQVASNSYFISGAHIRSIHRIRYQISMCFNVFHTGNTTKKPGEKKKKHFEMTWKLPCRESGHVWLAVAFWWLCVFLCVCCRLVLVLMQSAWTVSQQLRRLWRFFPRPMFSGVLWPERIAMERRRAFHRTTFWKSGERLHVVSWAAEENTFVGDAIWGVPRPSDTQLMRHLLNPIEFVRKKNRNTAGVEDDRKCVRSRKGLSISGNSVSALM